MERKTSPELRAIQAAEQLRVEPSTLRRWARAYENLFGPLPRAENRSRLFSPETLEHLQRGMTLLQEGEAKTIAQALRMAASKDNPTPRTPKPTGEDTSLILHQLLEEIVSLRAEVRDLREEVRQHPALANPEPPSSSQEDKPTERNSFWRRILRRTRLSGT